MDLYSRRIVGWSMSRWINRHLVIDALNMAIGARRPGAELIHHSDRGSQYTSDDFRDELLKHGIDCSMSGRGNCYDNAVVESFFGLMKREWVNRVRYRTRAEARALDANQQYEHLFAVANLNLLLLITPDKGRQDMIIRFILGRTGRRTVNASDCAEHIEAYEKRIRALDGGRDFDRVHH